MYGFSNSKIKKIIKDNITSKNVPEEGLNRMNEILVEYATNIVQKVEKNVLESGRKQ